MKITYCLIDQKRKGWRKLQNSLTTWRCLPMIMFAITNNMVSLNRIRMSLTVWVKAAIKRVRMHPTKTVTSITFSRSNIREQRWTLTDSTPMRFTTIVQILPESKGLWNKTSLSTRAWRCKNSRTYLTLIKTRFYRITRKNIIQRKTN